MYRLCIATFKNNSEKAGDPTSTSQAGRERNGVSSKEAQTKVN